MPTLRTKITPHLWFAKGAAEAARFYASLFPDSHVDQVTPIPVDTPSGPANSVQIVSFTLAGQPFVAIDAGPLDPFNHAISFVVSCADQAEVDHYWNAFADGGQPERCGWVRDRFGVYWQVVPDALGELMQRADTAGGKRVMQAMLGMQKLDVAGLQRAYEGT
ncbi:VOC family protein [Anaeromyxobacter paludicola]|uniref:VOC family protein n=1 Tax=Anaeromyxobacter paludicola TaxID=2918171 RepID=A0ABN6N8C4_9BACT|nr:VOC family protein [Anaeromyxobacter paludicola]BDG09447.1 VOC family protein [Anaeromyxobacter paludicola]